jgi:fused signal recognition particle receptor
MDNEQHRIEIAKRIAPLTSRPDKTRAVAAYLFLEMGEHPSAARVREYTGQGSLTDINRDLQEFWRTLRTKLAARLTSPDLPQAVIDLLGQFSSEVWALSLTEANRALDADREQAQQAVAEARQETMRAQAQAQAAQHRVAVVEAELVRRDTQAQQAAAEAAALTERCAGLETALNESRVRLDAEVQARAADADAAQRESQAERDARARDRDVFDGEIKFAKNQIESARGEARHWKSEFERLRSEQTVEAATLRATVSRLREELGTRTLAERDLAERVGELQGQLRALRPLRKSRGAGRARV